MTSDNLVLENAQRILGQIRQVVVGKDSVLLWVLAAILAKGHILLEDVPGVGKTTMALSFSKTLGLSHNRIQFTPDVLPSDVTGYTVMDPSTGAMHYRSGAVLCNLLLADELNRATSRTQSALLEAMEEGQVTVDGTTHPLPRPFTVIATQNPTGAAGTQLLPDSQMDRFTVRLTMGYPDPKDEMTMLMDRRQGDPLAQLKPLLDRDTLIAMQEMVSATYIKDSVLRYIVNLVCATRNHPDILRGASPRATLAMAAMSKSIARIQGRDFVTPTDVQTVFIHTIAHRLLMAPGADARNVTADSVLKTILGTVRAPSLN